ncbi:nitrilase family protein [Cellulophaga baltica]|uniref:nitrilase family protein n=2 Tax=Cellulophaga TaxID=104264 RepID=UPI002091920E|nr:nitrilase family protein [Cellulophaga baltica]
MSELKIALIQTSLVWENPQANRSIISDKVKKIKDSVDLIILPEMFTTGFTMSPEHIGDNEGSLTIDWLLKISSEKKSAITGSIIFLENGNFYNRLFFIKPTGEIQTYDKKHTFTLAGEDKVFKAGNMKTIVTYKGFKICPLICYDLRFPVWARNVENYDVLLYVANWPKIRINAWDILLKARAIENMAYCIGVNRVGEDDLGHKYSGHSAVYDALGNTITFSTSEEIVYAILEKEHIVSCRKKMKFLNDKDDFTLKD